MGLVGRPTWRCTDRIVYSEVWAFSFSSRRLSRLSCINDENLAIDSGGHVYMNSRWAIDENHINTRKHNLEKTYEVRTEGLHC